MKLILLKILLPIFVIIAIVFGYLWATRIEYAEDFLSKELHSEVRLGDISFGLTTVTLTDLEVDNDSYKTKFTADKVQAFFTWSGLRATPAKIDKIVLDNCELIAELGENPLFDIPKNFFSKTTELLSYLQPNERPRPKRISHHKPQEVIIKQLILNDLNVVIKNFWKDQNVNVKQMVLYNIKGDPTKEDITQLIFQGIISQLGK